MEVITYRHDKSDLNIYFLGDVHEGNSNHDAKAFAKAVDIIKKDENAVWIGMGDMIDAINHKDPRFDPIEIAREYGLKHLKDLPSEQTRRLYDKIRPIQYKCIALLRGNHEESYIRHNAFDATAYLSELMDDVPIVGYTGFVRVGLVSKKKGNRRTYLRIYVTHGVGGGGYREGYPINVIHDVSRWVEADVYVMGHIHRMSIDKQTILGVRDSGEAFVYDRWYGTNGCFLLKARTGTRGYFEGKRGPMSSIGMLVLKTKFEKTRYTFVNKLEPIFIPT